jgi:hypothetical protein
MRVLWNQFPRIVDALEPGGSGDMYAGLSQEEREALLEVTRMGFPPRAWFNLRRIAFGYTGVFTTLVDRIVDGDPTYFEDFWTKPGYLGAHPPESLERARIRHATRIDALVMPDEATPMALYHHVQDKAALAALVVDPAIRERPLSPPKGVWQEDLWEMARWTRNSTLAHPALPHLRRAYRVWTPAVLSFTQSWLGLWQQSGLHLEKAILAAKTRSLAIGGLVDEEAIRREVVDPDGATLRLLPNARLLFKSKLDREVVFELAVRSLVQGLHTRLKEDRRK